MMKEFAYTVLKREIVVGENNQREYVFPLSEHEVRTSGLAPYSENEWSQQRQYGWQHGVLRPYAVE